MTEMLTWDIYEIQTEETPINGVMLRGKIRKLGLEKGINVLVENTQDIEASVRFAILHGEDATLVIDYIRSIIKDVTVRLILEGIRNPVLSKLKINREERYTL